MDRRRFLWNAAGAGAFVLGCQVPDGRASARAPSTRLSAGTGTPRTRLPPGTHDLAEAAGVTGQLHVPAAAAAGARPLLLMLHGAGRSREFMQRVFPVAERHGVITATPHAAGRTWDLIVGEAGVDVASLDRVLAHIFASCSIDRSRLMLGGFSDGASYALSIGLRNGDLFTHLGAFAPGFMRAEPRIGRPRIFISHGTADEVLPLERTGAPVRAQLERWGYDVTFRTFDGGHGIHPDHLEESLEWLRA